MEKTLIHGGDWAGFTQVYGCLPLDFSANISPLGVPAGVQKALIEAASQVDRYPDPLCRALRQGIAGYEGVMPKQILCGNGAADLIFRAVLALCPRRALIPMPAFAEYETALNVVGCTAECWMLDEKRGFRVDETILDALVPGIDLLFLCEPNNPTGLTTPRALLLKILDRCRSTGTWVILDECFGDLLDDSQAHTMKPFLPEYQNLLILKAFTKLYAMPGVRLGYALCASEMLLDQMRMAGQPWGVSFPAQMAGIAALGESAYVQEVRGLIAGERPKLEAELKSLGLHVIPGEANYLLFRSDVPLLEPLRRKGILLRSCADYRGLDERWYRTAVRNAADNRRLIAAIREVLL